MINNVQPGNCGSYDVLVQNQIGIAGSSNAFLSIQGASPLPYSDSFAGANFIGGMSGFGTGSNVGATAEPGEPSAGFIPGGASVWLKWQAPSSGVATLSTGGSSFDTLLAVYTGTTLTNLVPVAADDDSAGFLCSLARFNAVAGTTYYFQVDGFYAIAGNIVLSWNLLPTAETIPVIVNQPQSQTVASNASVFFLVSVQNNNVSYQWMRNGTPINGATNSTFGIPTVTSTNVAFYQVLVSNLNGDGFSVLSRAADLQINTPDTGQPVNSRVRAESKLQAVMDTTFLPNDPYDGPIVTGYSGVETFSMYDATAENPEPLHCGVTCFNTKWHSYMANSTGLLSVSDFGTTFSGVMGVYTGPDFSLVPLACSGGHPAGTEVVSFESVIGTTYWISISSTNSAVNGMGQLQYSTLAPPFYTLLPVSQSVIAGTNLNLTVATTGNPAVGYQWQVNGTNIPGATTASININPFAYGNQEGNYYVVATNAVGTNIFIFAPIYLNSPLMFVNTTNLFQSNLLFSQLIGLPNSNYIFASSSDLVTWTTNYTGTSSATGVMNITNPISLNTPQKYYKAIQPVIN